MDQLEQTLTRIEGKLDRVDEKVDDHSERLARLESKFDNNGFVRKGTFEAEHKALKEAFEEHKVQNRDDLKDLRGKVWKIALKVAGILAVLGGIAAAAL